MLMRFCGLGVGHKNTWNETHIFRKQICEAFNIPDLYEDIKDASMSEEEAESDQGSESDNVEMVGSDDEWDDVNSDDEEESDSSNDSVEEGWCDEDDNPIDSGGDVDDVEVLGYSWL
ncbi:hypothetical protein EV421DRAFT_1743104 [Armillaria borealis]|uniref:Uncharacterized protein n=1 Tax=Armillaria borealis TaxID=47425 RepID=A0AA39MF38_9AGAR|nr:hypothetical protein EV421DRAFT_1743104 [Armillaria borealis]